MEQELVGSDLDAAVHRALGYAELEVHPIDGSLGFYAREDFIPVLPYSTDIAAAWNLVEEMREKGWRFEIVCFENGENRARFWLKEKDGRIVLAGESPNCLSAPEAICCAALNAIAAAKEE